MVDAEVEHAAHATTTWRKYSYVAGAIVGGLALVEGFIHLSHDHESVSSSHEWHS